MTEIDLVREKSPSLMKTCFLNKDKVKFLQIKQDAIRQICNQKHEKKQRNCVVHIRRDTPTFRTQLYDPSMPQKLRTYLIDGPFLNQKHLKTFEYRIHWNITIWKKNIYEKLNSSVWWNQNLGKQHYRIFSNKRRVTNKCRPLISAASYLHWNKRLPLISAFPLINAATLSAGLIRIVTIFTSS